MGFLSLSDLSTTNKKNGLLPVGPKTVTRMIERGEFPKPTHKISGHNYWTYEAYENWFNTAKVDGNQNAHVRESTGME